MFYCMEKYLYLTEYHFADAWINGGEVPLFPSSAYRKDDRGGIYTPDENLIDRSTHDVAIFGGAIEFPIGGKVFIGTYMRGDFVATNISLNRKLEDGLVLCLANRRSNYIAKRLQKKTCVVIHDLCKLKDALDAQIGIVGQMGECHYTTDHYRDHFLKSTKDSWQEEYRIFWPGASKRLVSIPKDTASRIKIRCDIFAR